MARLNLIHLNTRVTREILVDKYYIASHTKDFANTWHLSKDLMAPWSQVVRKIQPFKGLPPGSYISVNKELVRSGWMPEDGLKVREPSPQDLLPVPEPLEIHPDLSKLTQYFDTYVTHTGIIVFKQSGKVIGWIS